MRSSIAGASCRKSSAFSFSGTVIFKTRSEIGLIVIIERLSCASEGATIALVIAAIGPAHPVAHGEVRKVHSFRKTQARVRSPSGACEELGAALVSATARRATD